MGDVTITVFPAAVFFVTETVEVVVVVVVATFTLEDDDDEVDSSSIMEGRGTAAGLGFGE